MALKKSWKIYHLESFGADPFQHPTECPKLAKPITGIFIDGVAGGNSLFGGHENMVGKRISQEFLNLQHRHTLAMITDEAMTSQKCIYCLHQTKKATRNIYDGNGTFMESKPSRGTFISTNHNCHATTMSRDLMSSELMSE